MLSDEAADVRLSVLTMAEFWSRLRAERWAQAFDEEWQRVAELVNVIEPVLLAVVRQSLALRSAATARLPQVDTLIVATAALHRAILVHRDPHFLAIPASLLWQELLTEN
jgi:predicted nucleic acid-binding protein